MPDLLVDKNRIDVSQAFQTYLAFLGDVDKTAVAMSMDPADVLSLARAENWDAKVADATRLKDGDPKSNQIVINRAVNFVQAHRLRSIIDRVVSHLSGLSASELVDLLTKNTKGGPEFTSRPLADLVKAAEACQLMTQRALGDTTAERPDEDGRGKGSSIALSVLSAMNAADKLQLNSAELVRSQIEPPPRNLA